MASNAKSQKPGGVVGRLSWRCLCLETSPDQSCMIYYSICAAIGHYYSQYVLLLVTMSQDALPLRKQNIF